VEWSLDGPLLKLCLVILIFNQDGHQAKNRKRGNEVQIGPVASEELVKM
jgi:hypothetical protein